MPCTAQRRYASNGAGARRYFYHKHGRMNVKNAISKQKYWKTARSYSAEQLERLCLTKVTFMDAFARRALAGVGRAQDRNYVLALTRLVVYTRFKFLEYMNK